MAYGSEFVAVLGVACIAVGILIGILIMVCYNRIKCSVTSDQRHNEEISPNVRRASEYTLPQMHAFAANNPHHSMFSYPTTASIFNEAQALGALGNSTVEHRGIVTERANSHPNNAITARSQSHQNLGNPFQQGGINNVSKKTRRYSNNSDPRQSSQRTDLGNSQGNSRRVGQIEEISEPVITKDEVQNAYSSETNIKDLGDKNIPLRKTSTRQEFPVGSVSPRHENDSDIDDINDCTLVKMLAHCPDDIRTIFEPIESSKTTFLREKKIVYICKMLDDNGGMLELENMGISLFVPPGAIPFNQRNLVTLVLNWDLNDNPYMEKKEALVSPVVYCGPHGTSFDKPCILRFKHCAHDTRFARILTSETDLFETKRWQDFNMALESEDSDDVGDESELPVVQSGVSLDVNECEVEVSHFSLFTCIMRSKHRWLKKWIQVAVFTHDIGPERRHQQIRIYFLNKTPCALQWAIQNEAQYNFTLACPDTTFLFMEAGENMMIHLSYVSDGWEAVAQETEESVRSVFFEEIWHGGCPHTSMCFRKVDNRRKSSTISNVTSSELGGSGNNLLGESGKSTVTSEMSQGRVSEMECSEINIALRLNQEMCENLSVPLNVLAHNLKVNICDTQVKVIDEGPS